MRKILSLGIYLYDFEKYGTKYNLTIFPVLVENLPLIVYSIIIVVMPIYYNNISYIRYNLLVDDVLVHRISLKCEFTQFTRHLMAWIFPITIVFQFLSGNCNLLVISKALNLFKFIPRIVRVSFTW